MKYLKVVAFLAVVLSLLVTNAVSADDYILAAVQALKNAPVYVAPGTEGTDQDTAGKLQSMLKDGDSIVLVMLPSEAEKGTDAYTLALNLSKKLGDQRIIGMAVGNDVVGYALSLPVGVASDQMRRANSVSNDPITALSTFAENIHIWQSENPQQKPTPTPQPTPTPKPVVPQTPQQRLVALIIWVYVPLGIVIGVCLVLFREQIELLFNKRKRALKATKALVKEVQAKVADIEESSIRHELDNACSLALDLLDSMSKAKKPQGYAEEKLPVLVKNMGTQVNALIRQESGHLRLPAATLTQLKKVLTSYDDLFGKFQIGSDDATALAETIFNSNDAMIQSLGYLPADAKK